MHADDSARMRFDHSITVSQINVQFVYIVPCCLVPGKEDKTKDVTLGGGGQMFIVWYAACIVHHNRIFAKTNYFNKDPRRSCPACLGDLNEPNIVQESRAYRMFCFCL